MFEINFLHLFFIKVIRFGIKGEVLKWGKISNIFFFWKLKNLYLSYFISIKVKIWGTERNQQKLSLKGKHYFHK